MVKPVVATDEGPLVVKMSASLVTVLQFQKLCEPGGGTGGPEHQDVGDARPLHRSVPECNTYKDYGPFLNARNINYGPFLNATHIKITVRS